LEEDSINSNLKIIDFCTAKILKDKEKLSEIIGTLYYVAPEVLNNKSGFESDVWSCGIIMHLLLTGTVPFFGGFSREIKKKILTNEINYQSPIFKCLSVQSISLLKKLLNKIPQQRIPLKEAICDPWIDIFKKKEDINLENLESSLLNLKEFHSSVNFQGAIVKFFSQRCITKEEEMRLRQLFQSMDTSGDGQIDKAELINAYSKILGNKQEAKAYVQKILDKVDENHNETIDYNGINN